jgi:phosphatidylserine/phosphatidylglycerophosphate/cardiolipin synthase-like enzyme
MHNKVVVADGTTATGSFNFSANATRNAENVLRIDNSDLADQYAAYVDGLVRRYG